MVFHRTLKNRVIGETLTKTYLTSPHMVLGIMFLCWILDERQTQYFDTSVEIQHGFS